MLGSFHVKNVDKAYSVHFDDSLLPQGWGAVNSEQGVPGEGGFGR